MVHFLIHLGSQKMSNDISVFFYRRAYFVSYNSLLFRHAYKTYAVRLYLQNYCFRNALLLIAHLSKKHLFKCGTSNEKKAEFLVLKKFLFYEQKSEYIEFEVRYKYCFRSYYHRIQCSICASIPTPCCTMLFLKVHFI